jgi:hydroxymethylbilane synthase
MSSSTTPAHVLRLGTRASKLARWQADWVADRLRQLGHAVGLVEITTRGDAERNSTIGDIGTGVFTKEIQRALLAGNVDLAVHSLKDLPTEPVAGLVLAAVPARESASDVLVVGAGSRAPGAGKYESPLPLLSHGARVGTGSVRRQAQLLYARPDLLVEGVRGNVDTRLAKLDAGEFDALVLAEAGLKRLGLASRITQVLPSDVMLPAVGQGALGIECRADDAKTQAALAALDDAATHAAVRAERALLAQLRGGCLAPVGANGRIIDGRLELSAVVLSADGRHRIAASDGADPADAVALGRRVAEALLSRGAAALIAGSRT